MTTDPRAVTFEAIGTTWRLSASEPIPPGARDAVHRTIDAYDRAFSRFRPDSAVMALARGAAAVDLPPCAGALFATYDVLATLTQGAVSPLVGSSLVHLGYDAGYGFRRLPGFLPAPRWGEACRWDGERLVAREPVVVDVGAVGKGQLVDLVAGVLRDAGCPEVTVEAGGDVRHVGTTVLRVGLEDPRGLGPGAAQGRSVVGVVELTAGAVCGSSPVRRTWGPGLHHVLDARTGVPTAGTAATWGVAPTALLADAAATALFFCPPEALGALGPDVWGVALDPDGRALWSPDLPGEMFLATTEPDGSRA